MAVYTGTSANDTYKGTAEHDLIYGLAGNDILEGGGGDDVIEGGEGADTFVYADIRNGYSVRLTYTADGPTYTITDVNLSNGDEGSDTLLVGSGDRIQFADFTASVGIAANNNVAPILGQPGASDQIVFDNKAFNYQLPLNTFLDVNPGDVLAWSARFADGTAITSSTGWLRFDPTSHSFTATANGYPEVGKAYSIIVRAVDPYGLSVETHFNLTVAVGRGEDVIGGEQADQLVGTERAETLFGGGGDDILDGRGGADVLNGQDGYDTASYSDPLATIGVTIDLGQEIGHNGQAEGDSLIGIENVIGTRFADTLIGSNDRNLLEGGDGNDRILGGDGNDRLFGGGGNDYLIGGNQDDVIDGGAGIDTASYETASVGVTVVLGGQSAGFGYAVPSIGRDTLINIENATGSRFADSLIGDAGENILRGGAGNDSLNGHEGNDSLFGDAGDDQIDGGTGNDKLYGGVGNDSLRGSDGDDYLNGGAGADRLEGGSGIDTAAYEGSTVAVTVSLTKQAEFGYLGGSQDTVGAGLDTLSGIENLTGSAWNDTLFGSAGDNVLNGGAGNDVLTGNGGADSLLGGVGDDRLIGGTGKDILNGGAGIDTADYSAAASTVIVGLGTTSGQQTGGGGLDFLIAVENLLGSRFDDTLTGSKTDNRIEGGAGVDILSGLDGNDRLEGGDGADRLTGGVGADQLLGGNGADLFRFVAIEESTVTADGRDTILDFNRSETDKIGLIAIDANRATAVDDAFSLVTAFSGTAGQLVSAYDTATKSYIVSGDVNGDGSADFAIQVFSATALTASDFLL